MASMPRRSERLVGVNKGIADARKTGGIERQRRRLAFLVRHRGWGVRLPAAFGKRNQLPAIPRLVAGALAAGMGELNGDRGLRTLAHRCEDRLQRRLGRIVPQTKAAGRDAADCLNMGGLDAEHRRARQRQRVDVGEMPVIGFAVLGRVLAHRRDHDAIGEFQVAQLDRREQTAHAGISGVRGNGGRASCSGASPLPSTRSRRNPPLTV